MTRPYLDQRIAHLRREYDEWEVHRQKVVTQLNYIREQLKQENLLKEHEAYCKECGQGYDGPSAEGNAHYCCNDKHP